MAQLKKRYSMFVVFCFVLVIPGLSFSQNTEAKKATEATKAHNAKLLELLPFANKQDLEDATRGLVAPLPNDGVITDNKASALSDLVVIGLNDRHKANVSRPHRGGSLPV